MQEKDSERVATGPACIAKEADMSVPSPCINICRMHGPRGGVDDWCEGCARTIDEIAAWGRLDDAAKRAVWAQLPARRARLGLSPLVQARPPRVPTAGV